MLANRVITVALSILSRAVLFLVLSGYVYAHNSDADIIVFFQLLFLQSIVIAFLSASGFFRAQNLQDAGEAASFMSIYFLLSILSLLGLFGFLFFVTDYSNNQLPVIIVWVGAIFTSFSSPLSGYLLAKRGALIAFFPSILGATICGLVILSSPYEMTGFRPYLVLLGYQSITVILLFALTKDIILNAITYLVRLNFIHHLKHSYDNFTIGVAHTFHLAIVFHFRESWSLAAVPELAAAVFVTFRFSEAAIQLVQMVLLRNSIVSRLFGRNYIATLSLCLIWFLLSGAGVYLITGYSATLAPLVFAIIAQISLDVFRQFWSLSFLHQMEKFSLSHYLWFVILPPVASYLIIYGSIGISSTTAVYSFYLFNVLIAAIITVYQKK